MHDELMIRYQQLWRAPRLHDGPRRPDRGRAGLLQTTCKFLTMCHKQCMQGPAAWVLITLQGGSQLCGSTWAPLARPTPVSYACSDMFARGRMECSLGACVCLCQLTLCNAPRAEGGVVPLQGAGCEAWRREPTCMDQSRPMESHPHSSSARSRQVQWGKSRAARQRARDLTCIVHGRPPRSCPAARQGELGGRRARTVVCG